MQTTITETEARSLLRSIKAPQLDLEPVADHVLEHYGLSGEWHQLGGEREQNYRLVTAAGEKFVVKIASLEEDEESLIFQAKALEHIEQVDPALQVPRVRRTIAGDLLSSISAGEGRKHALRVLSFVAGETVMDLLSQRGFNLPTDDLLSLGAAQGRLARALQGFNHRGALRPMPWDLANGLVLGDWLRDYIPEEIGQDVDRALEHFAGSTLAALPRLRSQVIYNDFHESNVLVRAEPVLEVVGVIDFGDMVYGTVAQDLAVAVASFIHWSPEPVAAAAAVVRGYQRYMPLEAADLAVLKDLVLARLILQVGLVRYQAVVNGRIDQQLDNLQSLYSAAVSRLAHIDNDAFVASMTPSVVPTPIPSPVVEQTSSDIRALISRRQSVLGETYTFYNEPLELVRGRGTKLFDASGTEYLDCYNNVANVGHCHPYVVEALAQQAATLNTNSRYLHREILRLGERLTATLPEGLDTWIFVCTGSEANDLAVRIARSVTGNEGVIVTENSYHGNTSVVAPLSLLEYDIKDKPSWVEAVPAPNVYRGIYRGTQADLGERYSDHVTEAAARLGASGPGAAALLIDSIFDGNGALVPPPDYMRLAFDKAGRAGALCIADEVQMGFGRSGTHMWGFEAFGVRPDIVTMGKPMGNGHPIAALVTRRDIVLEFQRRSGYFNTFGGNTVSTVVANATLDVLQGENLQGNAERVGAYLKISLDSLIGTHELVGHIHGRGLFLGAELVVDRTSRAPAKLAARWVRERMKSLGVLVASTGPLGNIIKIRPPLAFSTADADRCFEALQTALTEVPPDLRIANSA
ncbi:aminotransferase class III-fold pyridoxal phosphate-dependent enzyme [Mesorhizobium sp. M4B.F.Ca.ET.169.01.1.1]|uniref:aminotransferase class III-fold pyridoxal phosphate-dependent enzyme n=1 Tax=unclassified Mesorhizobium TaxID=325217 RepID=UPI000FCB1779|nr:MULTISPECIES: aminotransferase class III-fold pyridoxal phosphate-dependent enzyme [unclassified Mesorhizobium]RVD46291.1 aminotransferase class III-fold pyridoxal phosphate-dependent enzyme [Mesorhizobium sp. M4B.F.Ca.ET.019.03.1.1]TGT37748.1 aminotransferase class III-fold pyridoxal phosphate-dependent enzyme [Mesorhizobium sp. M4B.F.Ca.ET.169.01.1.1]